jgi:hypothetical protein
MPHKAKAERTAHVPKTRTLPSGKIRKNLIDDYAGTGRGPKAETAAHKVAKKFREETSDQGPRSAYKRQDMARDAIHLAPHPKSGGGGIHSGHIAAARAGQAPPATSLMGSLGIIEHPSNRREYNMGIPGLITSTSLGPRERQRIVSGIIESPMAGQAADGPVHAVQGHDATAYNAGMVHIRGSHFK